MEVGAELLNSVSLGSKLLSYRALPSGWPVTLAALSADGDLPRLEAVLEAAFTFAVTWNFQLIFIAFVKDNRRLI